jgi:hypothetical protein
LGDIDLPSGTYSHSFCSQQLQRQFIKTLHSQT